MATSLTDLREFMLDAVGRENILQVDLVERYVDFAREYRKVYKLVKKNDNATTVINASQEFEKESIYHKQMRDINKEMLSIQRMLDLNPKDIQYDVDELT